MPVDSVALQWNVRHRPRNSLWLPSCARRLPESCQAACIPGHNRDRPGSPSSVSVRPFSGCRPCKPCDRLPATSVLKQALPFPSSGCVRSGTAWLQPRGPRLQHTSKPPLWFCQVFQVVLRRFQAFRHADIQAPLRPGVLLHANTLRHPGEGLLHRKPVRLQEAFLPF